MNICLIDLRGKYVTRTKPFRINHEHWNFSKSELTRYTVEERSYIGDIFIVREVTDQMAYLEVRKSKYNVYPIGTILLFSLHEWDDFGWEEVPEVMRAAILEDQPAQGRLE